MFEQADQLSLVDALETSLATGNWRHLHNKADPWEAKDLPTLVELGLLDWHLSQGCGPGLSAAPTDFRSKVLDRVRELIPGVWASSEAVAIGFPGSSFARITPVPLEAGWIPGSNFNFLLERYWSALVTIGLPRDFAYSILGAFFEIASNAIEHSESRPAPLAAFFAGENGWRLSVSDIGIGVLASLRRNPAFHNLRTSAKALRYALAAGTSRHTEPGRGQGFSTVFKALADRKVAIRIRSGSAFASWTGTSPTDQNLKIHSLPLSRLQGFHIALSGTA